MKKKKKNDVIKVHMKLIKKKCFEALFKNRQRLCVFNVHWQGILESRRSYRERASTVSLGLIKQVLPMTIPWMQNEDFDLDDEPVQDHKYRMGPFHSVLYRSWLES